jgi:hypothetical protein
VVVAVKNTRLKLAVVDDAQYELAEVAREVSAKVVLFSGASEDITRERVQKVRAQGYVRKLGPERVREDVQFMLRHA